MNPQFAFVLILLLVTVFLGVPTYLSLMGCSLLYFILNPALSPIQAIQRIFTSLDSFTLLAIPMFMFAGNIMNQGGITDRIFVFARTLVGRFPGGLAHVNTLSSFIFSGMSGSALADVGGLGQIELKAMRDAGYDDEFALGITAASATMGPIVPPSMPFVTFGAVANVSVGALFLAGIVPGVVIGLVLTVFVILISKRRGYPCDPPATLRQIWAATKHGFLALLMPVIILGSIWSGVVTPTEAAMVAVLYAMVLIFFIYKEIGLKDLNKVILRSIAGMAPTMCIIVGAVTFGWIVQYERLSDTLGGMLMGITTNKYILLLIVNIIMLFLGMFLDNTPVMYVMLPVLLPLTNQLGIHPVHLGVFMVLNCMIGLMTPPIGNSLFMLSSCTGIPYEKVAKGTWPWVFPMIIALLIIVYCPEVSLWLPRMAGFIR